MKLVIFLFALILIILYSFNSLTSPSSSLPSISTVRSQGCQLADSSAPPLQLPAALYQVGVPDDEDLDELPSYKVNPLFVNTPGQPTLSYKPLLKEVVIAIKNIEGAKELKEIVDEKDGGTVFSSGAELINIGGRNFRIFFPSGHTEWTLLEKPNIGISHIKASNFGLVFLAHLNENNIPIVFSGKSLGLKDYYIIAQVYQHPQAPVIPPQLLDLLIAECQGRGDKNTQIKTNNGSQQPTGPKIVYPNQQRSEDKQELQLEYFLFEGGSTGLGGVWRFHCKPAIYLYPQKVTLFNVRVKPKGLLTLTIPNYSESGWSGMVYPDGSILVNQQFFDYLYYEAKINDSLINKPDSGYVERFESLKNLFSTILPQLGLNSKQTSDFIDYWQKALPYSPYYFVGVMGQDSIDAIETLEITPKPDNINRVHLYFEPLNQYQAIDPPTLSQKPLGKFNVVEWGGMIKLDKDSTFTCSQ